MAGDRVDGRNINKNRVPTVTRKTVNSTTATVIAAENPDRFFISFCLAFDGTSPDVDVAIRAYPAATDNNLDGEMLTRHTAGNANLFRPSWSTPASNPSRGEFSGMSAPGNGDVDIIITEW